MLKFFHGKKKNKAIALVCVGALLLTTAALMIAPTLAAPSDLTETFSSPFSQLDPQSGTGYEYIAVGETKTLTGQGTYRWQSTNPGVVDVQYSDANRSLATVTGISPGAGTIINSTNGGAANSRNYAVGDPNKISYYRIPMGTAGLSLENPGDSATIQIYVKKSANPTSVPDSSAIAPNLGDITWISDDTAIATVAADARVTAVNDGTVVIRGKFTDPWGVERTISYPVTVGGGGTGIPGDPKVTGITVTPPSASMTKGSTQTFTAVVEGTGTFSQNVTWVLTGNDSTSTTFNSATSTLTVAANETAANLILVAKSDNPLYYQIIPITIPENAGGSVSLVEAFVVDPTGVINIPPGNTEIIKAEVFPKTLDQNAIWEVIGPAFNSSFTKLNIIETSSNSQCMFIVGTDETPKTVWLRVTCVEDPSQYETITVNIVGSVIAVTGVTVSGPTGPFYRGGGYQFTAAVQPANATNPSVTWSIVGNPTDATTTIDPVTGYLNVGVNESAASLTVRATTSNNVSGSMQITVTQTTNPGGFNPVNLTPVGRTFWMDGIEWLVLMRDNTNPNRTLVISRDIIGCRAFDTSTIWPKWQFSDMRMWLNGTGTYNSGNSGFINQVLSAKTRNMIMDTTLTTRSSKYTGTTNWSGSNPYAYETTVDKVFLLSVEEMFFEGVNNTYKYNFGANSLSKAQTDIDAIRTNKGTVIFNCNQARQCANVKYPAWGVWATTATVHYYTRSPGTGTYDVYMVDRKTGKHFTYYQNKTYHGVRPAMWLDASKYTA